jgi:hypothetical protein
VSNEYLASSGEYTTFGGHGMDDFVLDFGGGKTFVDLLGSCVRTSSASNNIPFVYTLITLLSSPTSGDRR